MARIYSPNEKYNCDYGVDFYYGAAAISDEDAELIAWFSTKGFTIVPGTNTLSPWDYLPKEQLQMFAPYCGIDIINKTKAQLVSAIETALLSLMKIEITEFDEIADLDGGTTAEPTYANAAAIQAVLPDYVTATFEGGIKVTVPITAWVDTDTYNAAAAASYTFTATLGDIPLPFANTANTIASIEVVVGAGE